MLGFIGVDAYATRSGTSLTAMRPGTRARYGW